MAAMFEVFCMTQDLEILKVEYNDSCTFKSEEEAWDFINSVMTAKVHPRFMWMRKVKACKSSTI
jgi:hypothetical protein